MSIVITSHADSIISALRMSNKKLEELDKSKDFLGLVLYMSNYFTDYEILISDDEYYLKRNADPFWITSGEDWNIISYKMISCNFNIKDNKKEILENLGFNTEPTELGIRSITIGGDERYFIVKK